MPPQRDRWRKGSSISKKHIHANIRLAQDGAKGSLGHVTRVVRDCGVTIAGTLVPDFVGTSCLAVKHEAEELQTLGDISVAITRQTTHYALRTTGS